MWSIAVDTGGTFTDGIGVDPDGRRHRVKVLSSGALRGRVIEVEPPDALVIELAVDLPDGFLRTARVRRTHGDGDEVQIVASTRQGARRQRLRLGTETDLAPDTLADVFTGHPAPVLAAHLVTGTPLGEPLPAMRLRLATTRGTNALLERRGAPAALFTTAGFADLLEIGTQARPDIFALDIRKPSPLATIVAEVRERLAADGSVLEKPDLERVRERAREIRDDGIRVAAVGFLHAHRNPDHERQVAEALAEAGFVHVSTSSDLSASTRLLPRAQTAVVDATLAPVIDDFVTGVREGSGGASIHVMTSAGGLVREDAYRPKDSLLSGPAGGVVGARAEGRRLNAERILTFDMGGTSTDVARVEADVVYRYEQRVGDAQLLSPAVWIETVAAGGGSVCTYDAAGLRVGPESAGADPGPAAYGAGGPLTITDVNLLLGRLAPDAFQVPVSIEAARAAFDAVRESLPRRREEIEKDPEGHTVLEGFVEIADARMADAIRRVSIAQGADPSDYALVAFGGAGGQHACGVASRLGIGRVIVPRDAGLLSAVGLADACIERFAEREVLRPLAEAAPYLPGVIEALETEARSALAADDVEADDIRVRRREVTLRFTGQDDTLEIDYAPGADLARTFVMRHRVLFGHAPEDRDIEVVMARVVASAAAGFGGEDDASDGADPAEDEGAEREGSERGETETAGSIPEPRSVRRRAFIGGDWRDIPIHLHGGPRAGDRPAELDGPAVLLDAHGATFVDEGWHAERHGNGAVVLTRRTGAPGVDARERPEIVRLELFVNRLRAIADEMGEVLARTALSVNVKERLDYSCAVLDAAGRLVVNAPHVPVHLGALGVCVRALVERLELGPGDVAVTNHPGVGGSHLPDVTLVAPVHDAAGRRVGYVANRAHHAEIGGTRPGSMPPRAHTLAEEGVVIAPMKLVAGGRPRWEAIEKVLAGAPHPTRALEENLADLAAQLAACHRGREAVGRVADDYGTDDVRRYMDALARRAASRVRAALAAREDGSRALTHTLDDDTAIRVTVTISGEHATVDFSGTAETHPGNLNATEAIVRSAVVYVLRLLVDEPVPLNEGLLEPVTVKLPRCFLNPPFPDDAAEAPAVAGGNVETSQRIVDALVEAFGLAAGSQGTMNNVLFGNERTSYYETIGGGAGAGPGFHGASAVHTHMTNTRITDPEVIESRYPVRVDRFAVRRGSGGAGRWRGGDGIVRSLTFLEPMALSIVSQHRRDGPRGVSGGSDGAPGRQWVERADGSQEALEAIDGVEVEKGDRFVIETPGGGGWGAESADSDDARRR